ncbi:hypothetical protein HJB90_08865 [Rhizobium sp. NLR10a]|uniref:hypothetical protein n=1 Tax=unclassified Rhizobium TaxID=2613769 RepID=UPI001C83C26C|nr:MULTISPECIES: hypothetical protein [unclassified Rhizobium]MBX5213958.1 hypothetical protein [Rhizobium sp. NLR9a]MBX5218893.1 hypothetical protein [Rhizobium sp. NLR8a]MBX5275347.1 hypothetical protein [Rhizobium sp. NLR13a]MBX5281134.1 hypothetical protein [Rhizobium sp. NLR10a]MBX5295445.1 hypothetical protein [Rhizobium sp. NLR15a]
MSKPSFVQDHFDLLTKFGKKPWIASQPEIDAKKSLETAYEATKVWAERLKARRFPEGRTEGAKHVIMRGKQFSPYTWWRVYPRSDAPEELAYTVGIDWSGDFMVKIDTYRAVGAKRWLRTRYEIECSEEPRKSGFWSVLPAKAGLAKSLDELVDWSIAQIDSFRPGYDELYKLLTEPPALQHVTDAEEADLLFRTWTSCLTQNGTKISDGFNVDLGGFVFSSVSQGQQAKLKLTPKQPWLVEVNQTKPSSPSASLSLIAKDKSGNAYLLRKGRLQKNGRSGRNVPETQFAIRSGIPSVSVASGKTAVDAGWYVVAALSETTDILIATTAQFVRACDFARQPSSGSLKRRPAPSYFVSTTETGGTYLVRPRAAQPEQTVLRLHGDVWLTLTKKLKERGIEMSKCRHELGYEIDGFFKRPDGRDFLVEIKTCSNASSIHGAVGQLHLYPSLMPELRTAGKFLLLPSSPDPAVVEALKEIGITVETFDHTDPSDIKFTQVFLDFCAGARTDIHTTPPR